MNSDIYWTSFLPIEYAVRLLEDNEVGIVGFTLHYEDGSLQHGGMKLKRLPEHNDMVVTVHEGKGLPAPNFGRELSSREVEGVTGALMVVRRADFLDQVFDEDYVAGDFEDGDLCLRMRANGKKVMLVECGGIYHLERQSIRRDPTHQLLSFINRARFGQQWGAYAPQRR
jgi:GT2 family glycosyltransferase